MRRRKIRRLIELERQKHHTVKQDTYIGASVGRRFLVRGTLKTSAIDKFIHDAKKQPPPDPFPGARFRSAWKLLDRFYKTCRRPIKVNGVRFCRKHPDSLFERGYWLAIFPCGYHVIVRKSDAGLKGHHSVVLWYRSSYKKNFPIAATTYDEHFTKYGADGVIEFIRDCILAKEFFQSESTVHEQIPL